MTGIYLKCDSCGATLGGEEATTNTNGLHWSQAKVLQDYARNIGWTGTLDIYSDNDKCPKCNLNELESS